MSIPGRPIPGRPIPGRPIPGRPVPDEILALARDRAAARAARDWPRADAARAQIEAAGWKVVDRGTDFRLEPAAPPTIADGEVERYGSAAAVPSALDASAATSPEGSPDTPPGTSFSVVIIADDAPDDVARLIGSLRRHAPVGCQVVVVANDPSPAQADRLGAASPDRAPIAGSDPEIVWTSARLGRAAAWNIGLRRACGAIVVLADPAVELVGDALTSLGEALADAGVAVAGGFGLVSTDLRHFAEFAGPAVDAIELGWLAARRRDVVALGDPTPLDEKFVSARYLDVWLSLELRAGPDATAPPRAARRLELPLVRHAPGWIEGLPGGEEDRLAKRNFYRVLERFRGRADLLSGG